MPAPTSTSEPSTATISHDTPEPTIEDTPSEGLSPAALRALVENHARFLGFLERRVSRRDIAEEILQEAFVRSIDRGASLRAGESATAWFYRLLRNALVDHFRRQGAQQRALDALANELGTEEAAADAEMMGTVCACVGALLDTLNPSYAEALRRVEMEGATVQAFAAEAGISANNAGVRLHRAREALRRQLARSCGTCATHGCVDCHCDPVKPGGCGS